MATQGTLTVVGTGIRAIGHITLETQAYIRQAEKVLVLVADPLTEQWVREQNSTAESLQPFYAQDKDRLVTYLEMVEHIMSFVRQELMVCAVFYGHPGVFAFPSHQAVRVARVEGYPAQMLASVSADACLYAELNVDPGQSGCLSFEATDYLVRSRPLDPHSQLVLWQIGVIGMLDWNSSFDPQPGLTSLVARLRQAYPADHPVTVYEASTFAGCDSRIVTVPLEDLENTPVKAISTLYVPPTGTTSPDYKVLRRVGVTAQAVQRRAEMEQEHSEALAPSPSH